MLIPLKIGTRVSFQGQTIHGTIDGFVYHAKDSSPFSEQILAHVKWDKGTDDWYKGQDLKVLNNTVIINSPSEGLENIEGELICKVKEATPGTPEVWEIQPKDKPYTVILFENEFEIKDASHKL